MLLVRFPGVRLVNMFLHFLPAINRSLAVVNETLQRVFQRYYADWSFVDLHGRLPRQFVSSVVF